MDAPDLRHIVVTWDLDEGTGLAVRYGDMDPGRAAILLTLAAKIVEAHAELLDELDELDDDGEAQDVEYDLEYYDEDDPEDDE